MEEEVGMICETGMKVMGAVEYVVTGEFCLKLP
jgi:hypothetical protein